MGKNPQIERLIGFLKANPGGHSSKALIEVLGLKVANDRLCRRILDGFSASDVRLLFRPEQGWQLDPDVTAVVRTEIDPADPTPVVVETSTNRVMAVSIRIGHSPGCGVHLPLHIAARILPETARAGEEPAFGPYIVVSEHIEDDFQSGELSTLTLTEFIEQFRAFSSGHVLLSWHPTPVRDSIARLFRATGGEVYHPDLVSLSELAGFLFPDLKISTFQQFLIEYGWSGPDIESPRFELDAMIDVWCTLIDELRTLYGLGYDEWHETIVSSSTEGNAKHDRIHDDVIQSLPEQPGVYIMENAAENPLYIGKSKCIKRRIAGYFTVKPGSSSKLDNIFATLDRIRVQVTGSELSAEILEAALISCHKPPFNTVMDIHSDDWTCEGGFFLVLPAVDPQERELHLVRDSSSDYYRMIVSLDNTDIDGLVDDIELFLKHGSLPMDSTTPDSRAPLIRYYGRICTPRWWRRNREIIPRYEHAHMTRLDMKRILLSVLDETFSPEYRYSG